MLKKPRIWAAGAMSGTSLDGVDVAMIDSDGEQIFDFGPSFYRPYSVPERDTLTRALGRWPGPGLERAQEIVETAHMEAFSELEGAELLGFHGQTLAHEPRGRGTHQLGDGSALASALGCPVVWDFRTADIQMGGEGAPLAPFFHFACARWMGATAPVAFLNLGGVGNITWVDPGKPRPDAEGALLAFDTGPANAPINDVMRDRLGQPYDRDGALARKGRVEEGALELFLAESYFARMPPKSLDRDSFAEMIELVRELSDADAVATLTGMAAAGVAQAMDHLPGAPSRLLVTGGGRHNPVMMDMIAHAAGCPVAPVEDVGLDGDMLEAQAFAYLAIRVARGLPTSCPSTTGVGAAVSGGTISTPGRQP